MKTDNKYTAIATIATLLLFALPAYVKASEYDKYKFTVELFWPDSLRSNHWNQCKPKCAYQQNGGHGFKIGPFGYYEFMNSYGDPGKMYVIEPFRVDFEYAGLMAGFAPWILQIEGYKKEHRTDEFYIDSAGETRNVKRYEQFTVGPLLWFKFHAGVNPYKFLRKTGAISNTRYRDLNFLFLRNISVNFNKIFFPATTVTYYSVVIFRQDF